MMNKRFFYNALSHLALVMAILSLSACGPRVIISTGTTLGLKATPGDGYTRPPQVTFGYKRAESALLSTAGLNATDTSDAFSTLAAFHFKTFWFGDTELHSFIGTGIAARDVQGTDFQQAFAEATMGVVPASIQTRRVTLNRQRMNIDEIEAQQVLDLAKYSKVDHKDACSSLQDYILDATTEPRLMRLEAAYNRLNPGGQNVSHTANPKCQ